MMKENFLFAGFASFATLVLDIVSSFCLLLFSKEQARVKDPVDGPVSYNAIKTNGNQ